MGTYKIPRDVSGEGRILMIFSWKGLLYSLGGALVGAIFMFIFLKLNMLIVGLVFLVICILIGFSIGTFKVPDIDTFEITRKTAGREIDEVLRRGIKFKLKGKRIYVYAKEENGDE